MWSPSINYLDNNDKTLTSNEKHNQHVIKYEHMKLLQGEINTWAFMFGLFHYEVYLKMIILIEE